METMTATNSIVYSTTKYKGTLIVDIKIRLNDECKNGHEDFSITGSIYREKRAEKYCERSGAIGDEVAKMFPEFQIFNSLHLSDANGAPMYAVENGFYHLHTATKEVTMAYLRITEVEYNTLKAVNDKVYFTVTLLDLGIVERWKKEAQRAIKILEDWTGEIFESTAIKSNFHAPTLSELKTHKKRLKSGYYNPEQTKAREQKEREDKQAAVIANLKAEAQKEIDNINKELEIKLFILSKGLPISNFIYYTHTKEATFNWVDYERKITKEEFNQLLKHSDLPKGVTFKLK